jgi:hypothetical protein
LLLNPGALPAKLLFHNELVPGLNRLVGILCQSEDDLAIVTSPTFHPSPLALVLALAFRRRGDHSAARLRMEQVRFDKERADEEEIDRMELKKVLGTEFQKWLQRPEIVRLLENGRATVADRINAIQRMVWGTQAFWAPEDERTQSGARLAINGDGI